MAALASVTELAEFTQLPIDPADASAAFLLLMASGLVRDYLQQDLDYKAADVVYCDPLNGSYVLLDQLPVTAVSLVEYTADSGVTWATAPAGSYMVSRRMGMIAAKWDHGIQWPSGPESWRVTYSHGFSPVPDTIKAIVCQLAGKAYATPVGVDLERVGQRQVKYDLGELSPMQQAALNRYKVARIA